MTLAQIKAALDRMLESPEADGFVAVAHLHSCLRDIGHRADVMMYVDCLRSVSRLFDYFGRPMLALEPAARAVQLSRTLDAAELRRSLAYEAIVLAETYNLGASLDASKEAFRLSRQLREPHLEAASVLTMGVALLNGGQDSAAMCCHQHVLTSSGGHPMVDATASCNVVLLHLRMGRVRDAVEASENAERFVAISGLRNFTAYLCAHRVARQLLRQRVQRGAQVLLLVGGEHVPMFTPARGCSRVPLELSPS